MKNKTNICKTALVFSAILLATIGRVHAYPALQIDIQGGTYVGGLDETTYCNTTSCDVYAIATASGNLTDAEILATNYYLSMALVPKTGPAPGSYGSFTVNGTTVDVTADMTYGVPPLEATILQTLTDPGDLPSHGIFETYFAEYMFIFDPLKKINSYDVQADAGNPAGKINASGASFYEMVIIDTTNLDSIVSLHFDLYSENLVICSNNPNCVEGDIDINDFAPFSHDGQTGGDDGGGGQQEIPEPGLMALFGMGLLGMGVSRTRRKRKAS